MKRHSECPVCGKGGCVENGDTNGYCFRFGQVYWINDEGEVWLKKNGQSGKGAWYPIDRMGRMAGSRDAKSLAGLGAEPLSSGTGCVSFECKLVVKRTVYGKGNIRAIQPTLFDIGWGLGDETP